jgi:6-phosphogluconolactonase
MAAAASDRASDMVEFNGQQVFAGGENSIAVIAIDPATGKPTLIQHATRPAFTREPSTSTRTCG